VELASSHGRIIIIIIIYFYYYYLLLSLVNWKKNIITIEEKLYIKKKRLKNIRTWTYKLNIIIIIIKFTITIITIKKYINLILRVKSIIIIIIIINLGLTSPSIPKKLRAGKMHLTQVAWEWQQRRPKILGSYSTI
jgi:hypothetical protein